MNGRIIHSPEERNVLPYLYNEYFLTVCPPRFLKTHLQYDDRGIIDELKSTQIQKKDILFRIATGVPQANSKCSISWLKQLCQWKSAEAPTVLLL